MLRIRQACSDSDIEAARGLFREYAEELDVDLCFQAFDAELAALPGPYAPPSGCLLLALRDDRLAGCTALKGLGGGICEMKRLYVRPAFRGRGIGRRLAVAVLDEARRIGYARMRLDTLVRLAPAVALYESLGFRPIEPYYENPLPGVAYLELDLRGRSGA